jgi:anti-sigma B factor antagonist
MAAANFWVDWPPHTTFVDPTGLGIFVMEHKRLQASGHKLTIYAPNPSVQRLLQITGLDQVFTIKP